MSGGSYDYICYKIDDIYLSGQDRDHRRASFQKLLKLISKAMHDIEWVDSYDYGKGDEHAAIDEVFAFLTASPEIIAKAHAYDALRDHLIKFMNLKIEAQDAKQEVIE